MGLVLKNFEWKTFCFLVRSDCVGDESLTDAIALFDFRDEFRDLKMVLEKPTDHTKEFDSADALFVAYQSRASALPTNASAWPMDLPTMFYDALPPDIRDLMKDNSSYNKAVTIACEDRAAPPAHLFSVVAQTTTYAWNASAIDGTDIICSVAAVLASGSLLLRLSFGEREQQTKDRCEQGGWVLSSNR